LLDNPCSLEKCLNMYCVSLTEAEKNE
jgi:hypothetical protein